MTRTRKTNRILSLIVVFAVVLGMFPMNAFALEEPTLPEGVYVSGVNVVDGENTTYWLNDETEGLASEGADSENYNVMYNPQTSTLTLNGYTNTEKGYEFIDSYFAAIYASADITIVLEGNNSIILGETSGSLLPSYRPNTYNGILVNGDLTVSGDGKFVVNSDMAGISISGDLIIDMEEAGSLTVFASMYAINSQGAVSVAEGKVDLQASLGMYSSGLTVSGGILSIMSEGIAILGEITLNDVEIIHPTDAEIATDTLEGMTYSYFADGDGNEVSDVVIGPSGTAVPKFITLGGVKLNAGEYLANNSVVTTTTAPASGGYAYYNNDVLTLNNYSYSGTGGGKMAVLYSDNALTVKPVGTNSFTNTFFEGNGIHTTADIIFEGEGTLNISALYRTILAHNSDATFNSGIYNLSDAETGITNQVWTSDPGGDVTIAGGTLHITTKYGINASGSVTFSGGTTTIDATVGSWTINAGDIVLTGTEIMQPTGAQIVSRNEEFTIVDSEGDDQILVVIDTNGIIPSTPATVKVDGVSVAGGGYWLYVNGMLTQEGANDTNYNVAYSAGTLTLKDLNLKTDIAAAIETDAELTINLIGNNIVESTHADGAAIMTNGNDITISGDGYGEFIGEDYGLNSGEGVATINAVTTLHGKDYLAGQAMTSVPDGPQGMHIIASDSEALSSTPYDADKIAEYKFMHFNSYDLWINGIPVTPTNKDDVLSDGSVSYIPYTYGNYGYIDTYGVVMLENANLTSIQIPRAALSTIIKFIGDNIVTNTGDYGIWAPSGFIEFADATPEDENETHTLTVTGTKASILPNLREINEDGTTSWGTTVYIPSGETRYVQLEGGATASSLTDVFGGVWVDTTDNDSVLTSYDEYKVAKITYGDVNQSEGVALTIIDGKQVNSSGLINYDDPTVDIAAVNPMPGYATFSHWEIKTTLFGQWAENDPPLAATLSSTATENTTVTINDAQAITVTAVFNWSEEEVPTPPPSGGGGGGISKYQVKYHSNDEVNETVSGGSYGYNTKVTVKDADIFESEISKVFLGWATKADGEIEYQPGDTFNMPGKTVDLYAVWANAPSLNKTEHYAYLQGYPDVTVRPEGYITREETAAIFFRLLDDETRATYLTSEHSFTDVSPDRWSNTAIATLAKAGIIEGRTATEFAPDEPITRAEFAAIAARFDSEVYTGGENMFTDIDGHWAAELINRAATRGWVTGDGDGTFRPNDYITRAEAATLINRVLERIPDDVSDLLDTMTVFSDNLDTNAWYYLAIQEATNSHYYERQEDGTEKWTDMRENPDWSNYE